MNAKNLIIDNGGDRETIEALDELLPKFQCVSALTLIVESVNSVDGSALVITSK